MVAPLRCLDIVIASDGSDILKFCCWALVHLNCVCVAFPARFSHRISICSTLYLCVDLYVLSYYIILFKNL
jgi:hypothetical protein